MTKNNFHLYVLSFYGPEGVYPMGATLEQVQAATEEYIASGDSHNGEPIFDSFGREKVRDILIEKFGLVFPKEKLILNFRYNDDWDRKHHPFTDNHIELMTRIMEILNVTGKITCLYDCTIHGAIISIESGWDEQVVRLTPANLRDLANIPALRYVQVYPNGPQFGLPSK